MQQDALFPLSVERGIMEKWLTTLPEITRLSELNAQLSHQVTSIFMVLATIYAVSIVLTVAWLLAIQRYIWQRNRHS